MSNSFLSPLTSLGTPDLIEFDRDSMVNEIITRIKSDPNWSSLWDGETLQNAAYMIVSTFSYLFSKNAESANRLLREVFITEAKDPKNISNILSSFSISIQQNTASLVPVSVFNSTRGFFSNSFYIPAGTSLIGKNINGQNINFECYNVDSENPNKIDYTSPIEISSGIKTIINAYSGTTFIENVNILVSIQREKFIYKINSPNIIQDSIRVYYEFGTSNEIELIETDSFVISPIISSQFPEGTPHYKIKYYDDGSADIIFGTKNFGGAFINDCIITVFYRVGGGALSNITINGINEIKTINISNTTSIPILFINESRGGGGSDREDINEAQFYGPYRIGRGRSIVDDKDAINSVSSIALKHSVVSPKYNNTNIPILHYWNYIAPKRNFDDFQFPTPSVSDTAETYRSSFEKSINEFLNLDGIHDGPENNLLASLFTTNDSNLNIALQKVPPQNGTLRADIYDRDNKIIDQIVWSGNYLGNVSPDSTIVSASKECNNDLSNITLNDLPGTENNRLRIKIDEYYEGGPIPQQLYFTLILTTGVAFTPISLAEHINQKIKESHPYYASFDESFCYANESGKIVFTSLLTGERSLVKFFSAGPGTASYRFLYNILKISELEVDASPQNDKILDKSISFFNSNNNNIYLYLKDRAKFINDESQNFTDVIPAWPDPNSITGPSIEIFLLNYNGVKRDLIIGSTLTIEVYDSSNSLKGQLIFSNITASSINRATAINNFTFNNETVGNSNFNWLTGSITFQMADSSNESAPYTYPSTYDQTHYVKVLYKEKTWKFLTVSYTPDPYSAEGEALSVLNILRAKDKKSLTLEPLLKKVKFTPVSISVVVGANKGKSKEEVIRRTEDLIYLNFSYEIKNKDMQIGFDFPINEAQSILNDRLLNPGISSVGISLIQQSNSISDNEFKFIFPRSFIEKIKEFEEEAILNGIELSGLVDFYQPKVN